MNGTARPHVLCVDDEQNTLHALNRELRRSYSVTMALGGEEGLTAIRKEGPFDVIISDMRMPGMDGAEFLRKAREEDPDSVRMLLTGYADVDSVMAAVNEGYIFRFITKPWDTEVLLGAVAAAAEQHRLITAEKVLLEQTLRGSVRALSDVLSLASPEAFGRATRIKDRAVALAERLQLESTWPVEVAGILSQIGHVTLPPETAARLYRGEDLGAKEQLMVQRLPKITLKVLSHIPRLEPVLDILAYQTKNFDGSGEPQDKTAGQDIPIGARILKIVQEYDDQEVRGHSPAHAVEILRAQAGRFDPQMLEVFHEQVARGIRIKADPLSLKDIHQGMRVAEDVRTRTGVLLVSRGQEMSISLLERLRNFAETAGVQEPIWIYKS
jgi:response regulator RpfG family c-di-GMP phosphodiesterase